MAETCECDPMGEGLDHHPWCGRHRVCGVCTGTVFVAKAPASGDSTVICRACGTPASSRTGPQDG